MVGSLPPYPYLTQIENIRAKSTLQLANLSSVNARYRRQSPNYRAFSDQSPSLSPAQQQLQEYQNTLNDLASPYAPQGRGYQRLNPSALPSQLNPRIGALLSQLHAQGQSSRNFTDGGSSYVLANISLKQNPQQNPLSRQTQSRRGTEYRLHYYQDSRQEILLLQDISNRNTERALSQTPRGILDSLQRRHAILGATGSAMQPNFGYNTDQDLILVRKAGEQNYRASNINDTGIGTHSEAKIASAFLENRLEKLSKIQKIQRSVDDILEANSNFIITTPRSQINLGAVRKNSRNMTEFFPGLRQGFGYDGSRKNSLAASQVLGDHYRTKYLSRAQTAPEGIARAYRKGGINPALYTNYSQLQKTRDNALKLPTALPEDHSTKRYAHLLPDGVLQFSNFQTSLDNTQGSIHSAAYFRHDNFQGADSLTAGSIGAVNAPVRAEPSFNTVANRSTRGLNIVNNIAGSALNSLSGIVDLATTNRLAEQKLGSSFSSSYDALLQGNIDVSSTIIQGLGDDSSSSSVGLYTIDVAHIGARSGDSIDINWQPNRV